MLGPSPLWERESENTSPNLQNAEPRARGAQSAQGRQLMPGECATRPAFATWSGTRRRRSRPGRLAPSRIPRPGTHRPSQGRAPGSGSASRRPRSTARTRHRSGTASPRSSTRKRRRRSRGGRWGRRKHASTRIGPHRTNGSPPSRSRSRRALRVQAVARVTEGDDRSRVQEDHARRRSRPRMARRTARRSRRSRPRAKRTGRIGMGAVDLGDHLAGTLPGGAEGGVALIRGLDRLTHQLGDRDAGPAQARRHVRMARIQPDVEECHSVYGKDGTSLRQALGAAPPRAGADGRARPEAGGGRGRAAGRMIAPGVLSAWCILPGVLRGRRRHGQARREGRRGHRRQPRHRRGNRAASSRPRAGASCAPPAPCARATTPWPARSRHGRRDPRRRRRGHAVTAEHRPARGVRKLIEAARKTYGPVDVLVNNAALTYFIPIKDYPVNRWLRPGP